ncbi:MAG: NHL repeat-containing protein [Candidatus Binatus sp.]
MRLAKAAAVAALLLAMIGPGRVAAAGTKRPTIFVANGSEVTAYPASSRGDVSPIALSTDMYDPNGIAIDASGRIYVANSYTNTVTVYAANANGSVPPITVIGGSNTLLANPDGIALDALGRIYVVNSSDNSIAVYAPLGAATGVLNEAPIGVIIGSKTRLDNPTAIALDAQGEIYVANALHVRVAPHAIYDVGRVTVYSAGSVGNVAPIASISGDATGFAYPIGLALDSGRNIYVANGDTANAGDNLKYYASITVYKAGSKGNASPTAIIAGDNTDLDYPKGIAVDSSGNLYATGGLNGVGPSINFYPAGSDGNVSPTAFIGGADTGLDGASGIAFDSDGTLYVANASGGVEYSGSITVYPAGSRGDAVPTTTITSTFSGFADGIAVDSSGNIYVVDNSGGTNEQGSIDIYPAGSYAIGAPVATISGDDTGLFYPYGIALDSSDNISVLNSLNTITTYSAGSVGDVAPIASLNVNQSGKNRQTGIAVDPGGNLYVANQGIASCNRHACFQINAGSVAVYPARSDGNASPSAVITGANTNLASPSAIAVDHSGSIYVANEGSVKCVRACNRCNAVPNGPGSVSVYAPGTSGNAVPTATIGGPNTGLKFPYEIAVDSNGNIYVVNSTHLGFGFFCLGVGSKSADTRHGVQEAIDRTSGPILIFAAGSNGDVPPIGIIGGPFTGLDLGSSGIAIGPGGP